jgi:hypothetical protein
MKLFLIKTDEADYYVTGKEEYHARDKVHEYIRERYFAGKPVNIINIKEVADENQNGFTPKFII